MTDYTYWFPEGFKLAEKLLRASEEAMAIELDRPDRGIIVALVLKCHRLMASSLISVRYGYAVEVEGNARTIQETLIALKYFLLNPERHSQMWQDFIPIANWKDLDDNLTARKLYYDEISRRFLPDSNEMKDAEADYELACQALNSYRPKYEAACKKRGEWIEIHRKEGSLPKHVQKTWSLKSNLQMASDTDMSFSYLLLYNRFSAVTHASVLSHSKYQSVQGGLWFSPGPHKLRQSILILIVFQVQVIRAVAEYYSNAVALRLCEEAEKELEQLHANDAFKEKNPLFAD